MKRIPGGEHIHQRYVPPRIESDEDPLSLGPNGSDDDMSDPDIARVFKEELSGHGEESGRAQIERAALLGGLDAALRGGDPDADLEDASFVGEEAPGGSEPTPDQNAVDEIGRAIGLQYADNEPLDIDAKIRVRDEHRWELDPASAEDYPERVAREQKGGGIA